MQIPSNITIYSDSLSALQCIQLGKSKSRPEILHQIMHYNNILRKNNTKITFIWIPSHVGILGNELADKFAKQGSINLVCKKCTV